MDRYLPVGTVCSINNTNRKYIIIGYFSLEYSSNIKLYDYIGLPYPEGFLMKNKINSFNHSDITNIEHLGLINEDFKKFNNILCDSSMESENKNEEELFSNFTFDENGVVIYEYKSSTPMKYNDIEEFYGENKTSEEDVVNPFNKIEDYETEIDITDNSEQWEIFTKNEYNENNSSDFVNEENNNDNLQNEQNFDQEVFSDGDMILIKNENYDKLLIDKDGNILIADEN